MSRTHIANALAELGRDRAPEFVDDARLAGAPLDVAFEMVARSRSRVSRVSAAPQVTTLTSLSLVEACAVGAAPAACGSLTMI